MRKVFIFVVVIDWIENDCRYVRENRLKMQSLTLFFFFSVKHYSIRIVFDIYCLMWIASFLVHFNHAHRTNINNFQFSRDYSETYRNLDLFTLVDYFPLAWYLWCAYACGYVSWRNKCVVCVLIPIYTTFCFHFKI